MIRTLSLGLGAVGFLLVTSLSYAEVGTFMSRGKTRLSLNAGYGSFNDHSYGILGAGAGYYFFDGFEAGIDGEAWLGAKPHIYTVSPEARYVITAYEAFKPYIGGFYKRTMYDTLRSMNSIGGRAGFVSPLGEHTYLSAGLVYERMFECSKTLYDSCDLVYPEVGLSFAY